MEVFKFRPISQPVRTDTFTITSVQFGDGYEQNAGNGINNRRQGWQLEFGPDESQAVRDFLIRHAGHRSFEWTNPDGEVGRYAVKKPLTTKYLASGIRVLSCNFEQVFYP